MRRRRKKNSHLRRKSVQNRLNSKNCVDVAKKKYDLNYFFLNFKKKNP